MKKQNTLSVIVTVVSVIGALVCLNILAVQNFFRIDLTQNDTFTLSDASQKTMSDLEDPIVVTAYFSENLPPPFSNNAQFVRDLLEEYRVHAKGMLSYEYIDPEGSETEDDKAIKKDVKKDIFGRRLREPTSVEKELQALGVQPVEIRVIEEDQEQTKRGYMGLVIRYQDQKEVIPVVQDTSNLEYNLTSLIRNLTRTRVPVLGITQGHGEPSVEPGQQGEPAQLSRIKEALSRVYEVKGINLKTDLKEGAIDSSFDALLVVGPTETLGEDALKAIDSFLMSGKSATFLTDNVSVDLRTFQAQPNDNGLKEMLSKYGIDVGPTLIADAECAELSVTRNLQGMRVQMPLPYPFVPQLKTLGVDHAVTRNISNITLPFSAPLYVADDVESDADRSAIILAKSSKRSWLEEPTPENMSPQRFTERVEVDFTGPYNMIAAVEGTLPSVYDASKKSEGKARVMVAGTSLLLNDQFLSQGNAVLAMNVIDWMLLDPALLSMRTRGMIEPPIDPELSDQKRSLVKWGNVVALPLLLVLFGVVRWRLRESRRKSLSVVS